MTQLERERHLQQMKTIMGLFGILLILVGGVWFFQGIGVIPGSFMTGQEFWAVAGILAVISGVALVRNWRRGVMAESTSPELPIEEDRPLPRR